MAGPEGSWLGVTVNCKLASSRRHLLWTKENQELSTTSRQSEKNLSVIIFPGINLFLKTICVKMQGRGKRAGTLLWLHQSSRLCFQCAPTTLASRLCTAASAATSSKTRRFSLFRYGDPRFVRLLPARAQNKGSHLPSEERSFLLNASLFVELVQEI